MPTATTHRNKPPTTATLKKRQQVEIGPWAVDERGFIARRALGKQTAIVLMHKDGWRAYWEVSKPGTSSNSTLGEALGKHCLAAAMAAADAVLRQLGYNVP